MSTEKTKKSDLHFCVIGAGASGIAAIKTCLENGIAVTCIERTEEVGGLWRYTDDVTAKASVAKSTVINTSKEFMAYSDFPIPAEYPNFMRHDMILAYFKLYVDHFGLRKHIKFTTEVTKVDYAADYATTGRWDVTCHNLVTGAKETLTFDGVLLCTGHHAEPNKPKFPGLQTFKGTVMHTHDYKRGDAFVDKNVLIIGIGNSGGDIAVELCRFAKTLHLSTRRGTWCFPRSLPNGMPIDSTLNRVISGLMSSVPYWAADWFSEHILIKVDHNLLGLKPSYGPSAQHVMINDDFPNRILSGLIKIQPDIKEFGPNWVKFVDGTEIKDLDAVILGTGYVFGFPFISPNIVLVENNKVDLYKLVFPPNLAHQTLAVIGCIQPIGAIMPISELQARWAVRVFSGEKKLPPKEVQQIEIAERRRMLQERYISSPRHTIQVDGVPYMDEIAQEVGCMPSVTQMLLTGDWNLAYKYLFSQVVPYQYRLTGPHQWKGAREAILTVDERVRRPLKTHIVELYGSQKNKDKEQ